MIVYNESLSPLNEHNRYTLKNTLLPIWLATGVLLLSSCQETPSTEPTTLPTEHESQHTPQTKACELIEGNNYSDPNGNFGLTVRIPAESNLAGYPVTITLASTEKPVIVGGASDYAFPGDWTNTPIEFEPDENGLYSIAFTNTDLGASASQLSIDGNSGPNLECTITR